MASQDHGARIEMAGVLCRSLNTNNETNEKAQAINSNECRTKGRQKVIFQQCNSQKPIPFTSAGLPSFIRRRTDFLRTEIDSE
jgi:hypothetical protein